MTRPLRLARRISRWGLARLLRFAWLRATGRQAEPEMAGCRDMDPPGDDRLLPETVRTLVMALECLAADGRDGLRAFLADRARPWFAELCQHLFHFAGEDNRDELEWLRWATQKRGYRPLEALLDSVLRRMDQPARSRSRTGEHRVPSTERIRELRQDPEHQTALQRAWPPPSPVQADRPHPRPAAGRRHGTAGGTRRGEDGPRPGGRDVPRTAGRFHSRRHVLSSRRPRLTGRTGPDP
ncbi:MAG: hypothetical protein R3D03_06820 [Geminicoccaceae bacterium]